MALRRTLRAHLGAAAVYLLLATLLAWPAVRTLSSRLWGDTGDAWQNLWDGWWMGRALLEGHSPMHTDLLWWPHGVSLWLHTLGPLNAFLTWVGQAALPGFAGYNLLVLGHLAFGAYGGFVLARALLRRARDAGRLTGLSDGALWLAALAGGAVFGFSPYTWAHVAVHLHLMGIGFVALFAHALLEAVDRPGWRWPLVAAVWALFTALVGWYLLVDEALVGAAILVLAAATARREGRGPLLRVAAAGGLTALFVLPLVIPTVLANAQPLEGTHAADIYSADLLSLVYPAPVQALGRGFLDTTLRFTGNSGENGGYLGYVALALTILGLVGAGGRRLWTLFAVGLGSVVVSLGPVLHVGGRIHRDVTLPYAWMAKGLPLLDGLGCPVRFSLVMNLALGAGVAAGLGWIASRLARRGAAAPWGLAAVLVPGALAVAEYAPAGQHTSLFPSPAFMEVVEDAPGTFAVADLTGWTHPLWNQMLHGRPIVHGYVSRRPQRYVDELFADPVLGPIYDEVLRGRAPRRTALARTDPQLDFHWGLAAPDAAVQPDFAAEWTGTLEVPEGGAWRFTLGSDDGSTLWIDGRRVVDNGGNHAYREASGEVRLTAGAHRLRVAYHDAGGEAAMVMRWAGPGTADAVVPSSALRTEDGRPGLIGRYTDRTAVVRLAPAAARAHLRDAWKIRYVIAYEDKTPWAVREGLGLRRVAAEDGLVLYEVPPAEGPAPPAGAPTASDGRAP